MPGKRMGTPDTSNAMLSPFNFCSIDLRRPRTQTAGSKRHRFTELEENAGFPCHFSKKILENKENV